MRLSAKLLYLFTALLLLQQLSSAASSNSIGWHNVSFTIYGLPAGAVAPIRWAPNYTTVNYNVINYTTTLRIGIKNTTNTTYSGRVPYQWQGAGTTVTYNGVVYTMVGKTYTQILNTNGLNDYLAFYVYLNESLWTSNEVAELQASNASLNHAKFVIASLKNTSQQAAYNGTTKAGNIIKTVQTAFVPQTSANVLNINFINTNVIKAQPKLCINMLGGNYCGNSSIAVPVHLPVINGKLGFTGKTTYNLSVTFSGTALNNINWNYSVIYVGNQVALTPVTSVTGTTSLSITKTYSLPVTAQVEAIAGASGNANYSKVYDDPFTLPANIVAWVNVSIGSSCAAYQCMIPFNTILYNSYIDSTANNVEAFYPNGTLVKSWFEGNVSNEQQTTMMNNIANAIYWVYLNPSASGTTNTFAIGFGTLNQNLLNNVTTGEAPQLSPLYAQYDNGQTVFTFYDNFSGSTLKTQWTASAISYTVSNELTVTATSGSGYIRSTSATGIYGNDIDFYGTLHQTNTLWDFVGLGIASVTGIIDLGTGTGSVGIQFNGASAITSTMSTSGYDEWTVEPISATNANFYVNYGGEQTVTTDAPSYPLPYAASYLGAAGAAPYTLSVPEVIYWFRSRITPPSVSMPVFTFSGINLAAPAGNLKISENPITYGASSAISFNTVTTDVISIIVNGLTVASGTTNTLSYTFDSRNWGAGSFTVTGNDVTNPANNGLVDLVVQPATPTLSFPATCATSLFLGTGCTTTANILTYNSQLTGNLYLNGGFLGSTTTTINSTLTEIGNFVYTFNTVGNGNYLPTSTSYNFELYELAYAKNVLTTGAVQITSANPLTSPVAYPTYYPLNLYTQSPSNSLNYSLYQTYNGVTTLLQANVLNINYIPPANQIPGNYVYTVFEFQQGDAYAGIPVIFDANSINMTDINGVFTFNSLCSTVIQYFPNCALFPFAANTFTAKPSSWYIVSNPSAQSFANGTANSFALDQFSTPFLSLPTNVTLVYPFVTFIANTEWQPNMQQSIPLSSLVFTLTNTTGSNRIISNFSIFSQETFNAVPTNLTLRFEGIFNTYNVNVIISNTSSSSYYFEMPISTYKNPNLFYTLNDSASTPLFYFHPDTYCPANVSYGSHTYYPLGLVDTNGSKYNFYVYTQGGTAASGDILQIIEGKGVGTIQVQSYQVPSTIPFALPLEATGQQYAFDVFSQNCQSVFFRGTLTVPTNPIYITLNVSPTSYAYNITKAAGLCYIKNTSGSIYNVVCFAADRANQAFKYALEVYNTTSAVGTQTLVLNRTFAGSSFVYNFTLPVNSIYSYIIYGFAYQQFDPVVIVNQGQLNNQTINLASPLLGFIAFIVMLALILGGASTGKASIMMLFADVGIFIVALFIDIPTSVAAIFLVISALSMWWSKW